MRISNIRSNTAFGKTVKVNMNEQDAFMLVQCINAKRVTSDKLQLKKDAKAIFDDTDKGAAVICSQDEGKSYYILTGEEATILKGIKEKALKAYEAIGEFYEDGAFADKNIEYISKKEKREINSLINRTKEPFVLTMYNVQDTGLQRLHKLSIVG